MIRKIIYLLLVPLFLLNLAGCWFIVGGAVGAAGAVVVSKDTVQGETDKQYDSLWSAARTVAKFRGTVQAEDYTKGYLELKADSSLVRIRLIRLTHATSRLKISARKYSFPNLSLAQEIYTKIMEEAK